METWLDHLELPDGQSAEMLIRLPYDRANAVEVAKEREEAITQVIAARAGITGLHGATFSGWLDALARAHLWTAVFFDYLTKEEIGAEDLDRADPFVIKKVQLHAAKLYGDWMREANPGPKGSPPRERRTRSSAKASPTSETSEPA